MAGHHNRIYILGFTQGRIISSSESGILATIRAGDGKIPGFTSRFHIASINFLLTFHAKEEIVF
jgi:hypothetical protein